MPNVIVPLDGSDLAERALPLAATLARLHGATIKLVQAAISPTNIEAGMALDMLLDAAQAYLDEVALRVQHDYKLQVSAHAAIAPAVHLILNEAAQPDVAAVVMSTHGRSGLLRFFMGSVAESVLRDAPIPVYLVPAAAPSAERSPIEHVLVPLDGSDLSYSIVAPVTKLAKQARAQLTLMRVYGDADELRLQAPEASLAAIERRLDQFEDNSHAYFTPIVAGLRSAGLKAECEWSTGVPAQEILATAELIKPDLIALATHGRSGIARLRYGSVAETVLRHVKTPVMTFGPAALKRLAKDVIVLNETAVPAQSR